MAAYRDYTTPNRPHLNTSFVPVLPSDPTGAAQWASLPLRSARCRSIDSGEPQFRKHTHRTMSRSWSENLSVRHPHRPTNSRLASDAANRRVVVPSDAQYLANLAGRRRLSYLKAPLSTAHVYHYGWVRSRAAHNRKTTWTSQFWQNDAGTSDPYEQVDARSLTPFTGSHPAAMTPWLTESANTTFEPDPTYRLSRRDRKQRFKQAIERVLPIDLSCTHYRRVRLP
jgi:hypothetical protein